MSDAARRWASRAWSLVAATWLAITVGWFMGKADTGQWVQVQTWLVPAWLAFNGWRDWRATKGEAEKA